MKLSLMLSPTTAGANKLTIKEIKPFVQNCEKVFVVVPDRASLITELQILKSLSVKGTFNLEVITINKLASKLLIDDKQNLSSYGGQLLIKRILFENKEKLLCFGKMANNVNFANSLYKTIEQFKSSLITFDNLFESVSKLPYGLAIKLKDVAFVWKEYDSTLKANFSDGFSKLKKLGDKIKTSDLIKNSVFAFLDFENITNHAKNVVYEIVKQAKQSFFALANPTAEQKNLEIYNNNLQNNLKEFAIQSKIPFEIKIDSELSLMENLLFAFNLGSEKAETNNIKLYVANTVNEEIKYFAKKILTEVANGKNFDDFNLALCQTDKYLGEIERVFNQNKIPFFVDKQYSVLNHSLVKFILSCLDCLVNNFQSSSVLEIVKNEYFGGEWSLVCDFENYVYKREIEGSMFFDCFKNDEAEKIRKKLEPIIKIYKKFKKTLSSSEMVEHIEILLAEFYCEEKTNELCKNLEKNGDIETLKISMQVYDKIQEVFDEINLVLKDIPCSLFEFKTLLLNGLENKKVSLVPVKTCHVYVGDLSSSYFFDDKEMIVLGASLGNFPACIQDVGIVSDEEAKTSLLNLNPTIRELNDREVFKVFNLCCSCRTLSLSYSKIVDEQNNSKSLTAIDLKNIFNLDEKDISSLQLIDYNNLTQQEIDEQVCLTWNKIWTNKNIFEMEKINNIRELSKYSNTPSFLKEQNVKTKFSQNEIAITSLEKYFDCPLKYFYTNVLKLKERETALLKSLDIGNLYHEFVYEFEKTIIKNNNDNCEQTCRKIFDSILQKDKFALVLEVPQNKPIIKNLYKEIVKIGKVLIKHNRQSEFKSKYLEVAFGNGTSLKSPVLKDDNKVYYLKGKIDRVDVYNDNARVIDYKTGSDKFSYKEIFFGKKIQLISYLKCIADNGYTPVGAYYFPLKTNSKAKFYAQLDGITYKDLNLIKKMDNNLVANVKSELINVKLKNDGNFNSTVGGNYLLSEKEISSLINYVSKLSIQAIEEIGDGYFVASPLNLGKDPCEFCAFKGGFLCANPKTRCSSNIVKENFLEKGENNER